MRLIKRVEKFKLVHWRKLFVRERREIIPDVTSLRVSSERARGIRFDFRQWITPVVRKKIVFQKIGRHHCGAEPCFSFAGVRIDVCCRLLAGMTSRAAFGKNFFSARHYSDIRGDVSLSTRRIAEMERLKPAKKCGDICQALFGRPPENGMLARISNLERFLRREPDQPVVPC